MDSQLFILVHSANAMLSFASLISMNWLFYCILVLLFWGLWAFLPKLATRTLDAPSALLFQQVGAFAAALCILIAVRFKIKLEPRGIAWAVLTGALGVAGLLCYLQAV